MGEHGTVCGRRYPDILHLQQSVYYEHDALVGQGGVAYCRAYALVCFAVQFLGGELVANCQRREILLNSRQFGRRNDLDSAQLFQIRQDTTLLNLAAPM